MEAQIDLDQEIQASFQKATLQRKKAEIQASRYTISGIVLSALATFVAGVPSLMGQPVIADWRVTCSVAALLTLAATIVSSVHNQVAKSDTLTKTSECVGRLRALIIDLQLPDCDYDQVRKQYQGVLVDFAELEI
jgi:hypothetical protein